MALRSSSHGKCSCVTPDDFKGLSLKERQGVYIYHLTSLFILLNRLSIFHGESRVSNKLIICVLVALAVQQNLIVHLQTVLRRYTCTLNSDMWSHSVQWLTLAVSKALWLICNCLQYGIPPVLLYTRFPRRRYIYTQLRNVFPVALSPILILCPRLFGLEFNGLLSRITPKLFLHLNDMMCMFSPWTLLI